jgi:hypothetical protein
MLLTGCSNDDETAQNQSAAAPAQDAWLLDSPPEGAVSVMEAKATAQAGDAIVVRARIGGRKEPLSEQSSVFTVMDLEVPHCAQIKGDACPTPWDYCCEAPESIKANSATVQVVGADGEPLAGSTIADDLRPLDEIVLVGTVGPRPAEDVLTVRATGVYRVPPDES